MGLPNRQFERAESDMARVRFVVVPLPKQRLSMSIFRHACFMLELPRPPLAERGVRVLFDPVFCSHCSPLPAKISSKAARFSGNHD